MEDWITGTLAVLGTLMVLAGVALIVLRAVGVVDAHPTPEESGPGAATREASTRRRGPFSRMNPATQLISWGVLLLVLAAVTVGLISLGVTVEAGTDSVPTTT